MENHKFILNDRENKITNEWETKAPQRIRNYDH